MTKKEFEEKLMKKKNMTRDELYNYLKVGSLEIKPCNDCDYEKCTGWVLNEIE